MTPLEVLREARRLLDVPEAWTKGSRARDERGRPILPGSPEAVCWCLYGACERASNGEEFPATSAICCELGRSNLGGWNDEPGRTHADVIGLLDQVIANLEKEDEK